MVRNLLVFNADVILRRNVMIIMTICPLPGLHGMSIGGMISTVDTVCETLFGFSDLLIILYNLI